MKQRSILLFDDWSKGANTRDKLLPQGVSAKIENFSCDRKGTLEKGLPYEAITTPADKPWGGNIHRIFYWYSKDKDYQVYLADVGETSAEGAMIAIHDGTSNNYGEGANGWQTWTAQGGFFECSGSGPVSYVSDLEDVIFISSLVGGVPCLRVYPIYPSTTDEDEWVCLRIFAIKDFETFEQVTFVKYTGVGAKNVAIFDGNKVECACGQNSLLQPCGKTWADCSTSGAGSADLTDYQVQLETEYDVGDILGIEVRAAAASDIVKLAITEILSFPSEWEAVIAGPVSRVPDQDGSLLPGEVYELTTSSSTSQSKIGLLCLKGLPLLTSSHVDDEIYITTSESMYSQGRLPSDDYFDCVYEGGEMIEYGFALVLWDGQFGNMIKKKIGIDVEDFETVALDAGGTSDATGLVSILLTDNFFEAITGGATDADDDMAHAVTGLAVWRKNPTDEEFKLLGIIDRKVTDSDLEPYEGVCSYQADTVTAGYLLQMYMSGNNCGYLTMGVLDWGQTLADNVFSATGGLEEEDIGVELGIKAPALWGRKIYAGNIMKLKRWDDTHDPEFSDDELVPSLVDGGEMFPGTEYLEVVSGESDQIKRMVFHGRQMIVFKRGYIMVLEMLGQSEGAWKVVAKMAGGVSDYYHVCETPFGPAWLSDEQLYLWDGKERRPLSMYFQDDYRAMYGGFASTMSIGYDGHTSKLWVGRTGVDIHFMVNLRTGAFSSIENGQDCQYFGYCNDLTGRLVGLNGDSPKTARFIEVKEIDLSTGTRNIGTCTWGSGELDLLKMAGEAKLYRINMYISYKRKDSHSGTHTLQLKVSFDGASQVTYTYDLPSGTQEDTIIAEFDIWNQGKTAALEFNTNEGTVEFDYFRIWKIVGVFGSKGVE